MSRITKWKLEKTKVKVVFRLQFHATHIPQPGWDKLFVSFIPSDSGKATAKTTKANVRNGTCKWSDPIYETTRLLQDAKTKKYDEKFFKLVVAMGSSRSSLLGEANINLADYADASKPLSIALPLQGCNSGAVLHVTVQLLTSKTGFREFEQQRELREKGFQKINDQTVHEEPSTKESTEIANDHIDKVNARVRFKPEFTELPSLEEEEELNDDNTDSAVGMDGSSHTSESLYAEKHDISSTNEVDHDISSTNEVDSLRSTISGELGGHSFGQNIHPEKGDGGGIQPLSQGNNDWVHGWSSDYSMDNELATAYEENSRLKGCLEVAEASIQQLKLELGSLHTHVDELGSETQMFTQQLASETALGEELAREVSILKSECSKLKGDFKELKNSKQSKHFTGMETELLSFSPPFVQVSSAGKLCNLFEGSDCDLVVDAFRKNQECSLHELQMKCQQGLLLMEDKVREIQNKACLTYHERDIGFLHSDLEVLDSVVQDLKKGTIQLIYILNAQRVRNEDLKVIEAASALKSEQFIPGGVLEGVDANVSLSEGQLNSSSMPGQLSGYDCREGNLDATDVMTEKMCELVTELEESKAERENVMKKMVQMECYYEGLIQELEESQRQMLDELQNLRNEHSTCLYTISTFKSQVETLNQDMNEQLQRFAEVRHGFESKNKELEKRASGSETALRRLRLNYSIAVGQLQKDLEVLSFQVLSMFETKENLARQAFAEASQLCLQEYTDENSEKQHSFLEKDDLETAFLKEQYKSRVQALKVGVVPWKLEQEVSSQLSGPPMKLNEKMIQNVDHIVSDNGTSLKEVPMHAETTSNDGKSTFSKPWTIDLFTDTLKDGVDRVNGLRLENAGQLDVPQTVIPEKKNLLHHGDLVAEPKKELSDADFLLEDMKRSLQLQEELRQKAEAELSEMHLLNVHLEVFSNVLQETLHAANNGVRLTEAKVDDLAQQLERSTEFNETLMSKLQAAKHEVEELRKSESNCMTKCDDFTVKNYTLEAKLQHISEENRVLTQKVTECERSLVECRSYQSLYEYCTAEKNDLEKLLELECSEKCHLQDEISSVIEELERQSSAKGDLEKTVMFLQDKLRDLRSSMVSCSEQISGLVLSDKSLDRELDEKHFESTFLHLEELQRRAHEQILRLSQEKRQIMEERDIAQGSLSSAESQILFMKEKFESEKNDLEKLLELECSEKCHLQDEISSVIEELERQSSVKGDLEKTVMFLQDKLRHLRSSMISCSEQVSGLVLADNSLDRELDETHFESTFLHLEELQRTAHEQILRLSQEKKQIMEERDIVRGSLNSAESQILFMKEKFEQELQDVENAHVGKLQQELQDVSYKLSLSLEAEEKYAEENRGLLSKLTALETELQHVTGENRDLAQKILTLDSMTKELEKTKLAVIDCMQENEALMMSIQAGKEASVQLANEFSSLKESLRCGHDELLSERSSRAQLEATVRDLTFQLNAKHEQMPESNSQKAELVDLKQQISELELELSRAKHLLLENEQTQKKAAGEASSLWLQVIDLETQLETMHELLLGVDVEVIFLKDQFQTRMQDLLDQLRFLETNNADIHLRHLDVVSAMNARMASEVQCMEENAALMIALQSMRSDLETVVSEKRELVDYVDKRSSMWAELENSKAVAVGTEVNNIQRQHRHEVEIEQLNSRLVNYEEEIVNLRSARDELEITVIVLKSKIKELHAQIPLLQEHQNELLKLHKENHELSYRLSEQTLKTEEFKNLSIHLKGLKDKADAEFSQARERRETEGPSVAVQESLRMAFIREQCETKLQELKSQLYVSKKHGEEMLLKLQDALDEIENRKKGEASQAKRNEELSKKILELETELQTALAEKREKVKVYDRMKAELECSMLSLDCCKEEKLMLEACLQECNEERARIAGELYSMKEQLERSAATNIPELRNHEHGRHDFLSIQPLSESDSSISSEVQSCPGVDAASMVAVNDASKMDSLKSSDTSLVLSSYQEPLSIDEGQHPSSQDALVAKSSLEVSRQLNKEKEDLLQKNMNMALINDHFKEQPLKSSMERLHKELERMKNENLASHLRQEENHSDPIFQGLQRELLQLHAANERLGSIFPLFNEFSGSGNALERVLALEIELAEALQSKKKSSIHFQSSFLKQHNDEEAVFQSFRDINELIKDMLEIKRRSTAVEIELKEMQERYLQLSLQFAEVEGERQQLVMTLKNARPAKKT